MSTDDARVVASSRPGARRIALFAAATLITTSAAADTLTLHNGDRLTGRILHMSPSTVTFETTWAGEMKIPRYEVRAIETDKPVTVLRERAAAPESATLKRAGDGQVTVVREDAAAPEAAAPPVGEGGPVKPAQTREARAPAPTTIPITGLRYINPRPEESGQGASYAGRVNVAGTASRGSHVSNRFYAEGDVSARSREWHSALNAKMLQENGESVERQSNWLVAGNMDRLLEASDFAYVRMSAERDQGRDIAGRTTIGGGYGRELIDSGRTTLSVRAGLELVDLRRHTGPDEAGPALGWGLNFTHRLDTLSTELFHDHRGFRIFEQGGRTTLRSRSGLRVPLRSGLTASLQVNHAWESTPPPGRKELDTVWLLGLGYAW